MPDILKLQLPISMQDVIRIWARQAGYFDKSVPLETQEKKYMNALMELFSMFAKHHGELDDSNFIRIFRFFKDSGFTKRLHPDTDIAKRSAKLEVSEPDMIPVKSELHEIKNDT